MKKLAVASLLVAGFVLFGGVDAGLLGTGAVEFDSVERQDAFAFEVTDARQCGPTCTTVTAVVTNTQADPASDVTVSARVYAGRNTTSGNVLWAGTETVGTVDADTRRTITRRADWGLADANAVRQRGGWITAVVVVDAESTSVTFRGQRRVT